MAAQHPNIVWIFLDQCRADVLGAYGHPFVQTPNLDRLAHSGVLFEHAYCQNPICVPSRVSILSGLYSHQNGVFNNADKMNPDDSLLLLSWPGRMPAGKRVTDLVEMVDFLPTLCELADLPVPERAQGRSLLPLIAGESAGRDAVFAEQKVQDTHLEAVRTTRYAYTRYRNSGDRVLFDLESDPHEQTNLMQRDPPAEVIHDLEKRLDTWLET